MRLLAAQQVGVKIAIPESFSQPAASFAGAAGSEALS
jgi:hypothetical protein